MFEDKKNTMKSTYIDYDDHEFWKHTPELQRNLTALDK